MRRHLLWLLLVTLGACGGRVSAYEDASSVGDDGGLTDAAPEAVSLDATAGTHDGTFPCSSVSHEGDAVHCSLATQFCAANGTVGGHACQPFGTVCHSCECLLKALQDPDPGDAYVPFDDAPPSPNASGCYGDAATGVTLYLSE